VRFKLDENVHPDVRDLLRRAGHDAVTVRDEGLRGAWDPTLDEACRREGRALITLDLGFGDVRTYPPADRPGIIVLRLTRQGRSAVLSAIERVLPLLSEERLSNRLWVVDERTIRVRGEE
jgi:predicted nuclease of predicted toxin-antitoxin system